MIDIGCHLSPKKKQNSEVITLILHILMEIKQKSVNLQFRLIKQISLILISDLSHCLGISDQSVIANHQISLSEVFGQ